MVNYRVQASLVGGGMQFLVYETADPNEAYLMAKQQQARKGFDVAIVEYRTGKPELFYTVEEFKSIKTREGL